MLTNIYIDGFNLYHRAVKDTAYKWLDLRRLAAELFPSDEIQRVHYFTSRLIARPNKPKDRAPPVELREAATRVIRIRKSHLKGCQLDPVVYDANGAAHKPAEWA